MTDQPSDTSSIFVTRPDSAGDISNYDPNQLQQPLNTNHRLLNLTVRSNIRLANSQDLAVASKQTSIPTSWPVLRGLLTAKHRTLNVVEIFAGAGGMSLGFLMAKRGDCNYRIVFSGEINPIYVQTLVSNQQRFAAEINPVAEDRIPEGTIPTDLTTNESLTRAKTAATHYGEVDILIGGPPCQGFSNSNRQSRSKDNPNNLLVEAFLTHVNELNPRVMLLENVQGILWTPSHKQEKVSVARYITRELEKQYLLFPKLLDAVWYGVPQYRTRFFLLGIRRDLGYTERDFGDWGPFPLPTFGPTTNQKYVNVGEAIGDLPEIGNGASDDELKYHFDEKLLANTPYLQKMMGKGPADEVFDHITSKHADYVIDRYRQIREGENWESIRHLMDNYENVERTHSNIYKRLRWNEPAITMGHYRKSMLIHPRQDRGLSLREACRLQSFPDWFRFAGTKDGGPGGLMYKQQQLANAVCPLVAKAIAEYLLEL